MTEQKTVALDEVVREFTRAREGLSSVVGKLRDLEDAEKVRREQAEGFATATGCLAELSDQLTRAAISLEETTASVANVLRAAESALQATDASQLMSRIDDLQAQVNGMNDRQVSMEQVVDRQTGVMQGLTSAVQSRSEQTEPRLVAIESSTGEVAMVVGSLVSRLDDLVSVVGDSHAAQQENAALRAQLEKVKAGLKPRQLASLGLAD
jgi:chromosome segregation ATPase